MQNKHLKLIALTLIVCLMATLGGTLIACNEDTYNGVEDTQNQINDNEEDAATPLYKFGVVADAQVYASSELNNLQNTRYQATMYQYGFTSLNELSEAIFFSAVDAYIESGVDYVLMIGDLTHDRGESSINLVVEGCAKLWEAGIPVYPTMGINDTNASPLSYPGQNRKISTPEWHFGNFAELFSPYMGTSNISWDTNSYSYSVDLPGSNLRLISLDSASTYDSKFVYNIYNMTDQNGSHHGSVTITDAQMQWLEKMLFEAQILGREVIVTSYLPIDPNMAVFYGPEMSAHYILQDRNTELQNLFIKYGVKCVFNGHLQTECTKTYTNDSGSLLEICSTAQGTYPIPIKTATYYDDGSITTAVTPLGKLNASYLPPYISPETITEVTTNLTVYAKERLIYAVTLDCVKDRIGYEPFDILPFGERLLSKLCIYDEESEACQNVIKVLDAWLLEVNNMKIYGETDSLEAICKMYGVTLPKSNYVTVMDFILDSACKMYTGDFEFEEGGTTHLLYKYTAYCGFYLLAKADLFGILHAVEPTIKTCDLMPLVEKAFCEDVLDLTINDAVLSLFSSIAPVIKAKTGIMVNPTETESFLHGLSVLLPLALPALGEEYDVEKDTLWGVPYKNFIDLTSGQVFVGKLISEIGADGLAEALFSSL